ncbi:hypothetical protein [Halococcoides cellulosivorans]|uniref:hypothetical protein n=1 Tax=Halococcoides cellulosivorans TaxID=1679096 RepID=UPI00131EEA00|nr:hypothetical protein [Halococcoides cellulosivorans]
MSRNNGEKAQEDISIGSFLDEFYPQFAIMGIFGTVTLVISTYYPKEVPEIVGKLGIFASLTIFSLTSFWLTWRIAQEYPEGESGSSSRLITEIGFGVLFLCTLTLFGSMVYAITTYDEIINIARPIGTALVISIIYLNKVFPSQRYNSNYSNAKSVRFVSLYITLATIPFLLGGIYDTFQLYIESSFLLDLITMTIYCSIHLSFCEITMLGYKLDSKDIDILHVINSNVFGRSPRELTTSLYRHVIKPWGMDTSVAISYGLIIFIYIIHVRTNNINNIPSYNLVFQNLRFEQILILHVGFVAISTSTIVWLLSTGRLVYSNIYGKAIPIIISMSILFSLIPYL